ncbi:MAG: hypothetical protein HOP28_14490 [Gemmatimonadales bacterium]|nr:hypothetical protein [Gemmatimonadales bacterium]
MKPTPASLRLAASLVLVAGLAACGRKDPRLETLSAGISKDSATAVMGAQPVRLDPYLTDGLYVEAMYFTVPGETEAGDRKMSPVVAIDGKLAIWGWKSWDSLAAQHKIQVAPK